jgi:DNA-binding HxlR family transcriptional regulator
MSQVRSGCPINLTLEALGDRWSLIVIRDIMFGGRRHFRELQAGSIEGIASNILADRLKRLVAEGLLTRSGDPSHRQKAIYGLTEKAIALVPLVVAMGAWGRRFMPVTPDLAVRARVLEEGGPALWEDFMAELRHVHLGKALPKRHVSVAARLAAEYRRVVDETSTKGQGPAMDPPVARAPRTPMP